MLSGCKAQNKSTTLEVTHSEWKTGEAGMRFITGTAVNNSAKSYAYAQVEFNLFDKSGKPVGSAMANIDKLEPGKSGNFEAVVIEANAADFKVKEISGF